MRIILALAVAAIFGIPASAAPIDWADWSNTVTPGNPAGGVATATVGANSVTYLGELLSLQDNYPSWTPVGTFSGGSVGNPPPVTGGIIQLQGGHLGINSITFLNPVVDPVMAIWSLGQGGIQASFDFNAAFTIESGGPSFEYSGGAITSLGNDALGLEGNGTIQFHGVFTSILWTNPTYEYWYGFTVGVPVAAETPIPAALPLFAGGLGVMAFLARRRKQKAQSVA